MTSARSAAGRYWETVAADHLIEHGLSIVERGYRCRLGELDILCRDGAALVVVEVRARGRNAYVGAAESVDRAKRRKILRATRHFLMRHPEWQRNPLRFDVIAIDAADTEVPVLSWIRNAFDAG